MDLSELNLNGLLITLMHTFLLFLDVGSCHPGLLKRQLLKFLNPAKSMDFGPFFCLSCFFPDVVQLN